MTIAVYSDLTSALADWLNRADLSQRIPDFITLAETSLNKVLRSSWGVETSTVAITAATRRSAALPADLLELIYVQVTGSDSAPLEQVSPQQLVQLRRNRLQQQGVPIFYALIGRTLELAPTPAASTTLDIDYYGKIPPLNSGNVSNWLITQYPDLYLYTSLLHAAPYLKDDARTQLYQNLLAQQIASLIQQNQTATFDEDKTAGFSLRLGNDVAAGQAASVAPITAP